MKGTLLSFDFVKDANGDLKFLEMNTDTTISKTDLDNYISWDSLIDVMSGSNSTTLDVIYKPEIHDHIVNSLSASVIADAPFITSFNHYKEALYSNFPTAVPDAADKFVLRIAYDDNAVLDSYYCKEGDKPLRLLTEYNSASLGVPYYYSGSDGFVDSLTTSSNSAVYPDLVVKKKVAGMDHFAFVKTLTNDGYDDVKAAYSEDNFITNYLVSPDVISDGVVNSYRHFCVAWGGGLESAHLGSFVQYGQFGVPSELPTTGSTYYSLPKKHYWEYSTSTPKDKQNLHGIYYTDRFMSASNEPIEITDITMGTELKSFYIPTLPDTDDPIVYYSWEHDGKTLPGGTKVTSSVSTGLCNWYDDTQGVIFELQPQGACTPVYLGMNAAVITYNTGSDNYAFRPIKDVKQDEDFLFDLSGSLVPITSNNFVVLHQPTGSFIGIDVEPFDMTIVDTDADPDIISVTVHNIK